MRFEERAMDEFERELGRALRRVDAPERFAERVYALSEEKPAGAKVLAWPRRRAWMSGAMAAGLMLAAVGSEGWHLHRVAQRRVAEAQFATAMQVTDRTLEKTRMQLSRSGLRLFNE